MDPDLASSEATSSEPAHSSEQGKRSSRKSQDAIPTSPGGVGSVTDCTTLTIKHVPRTYTEQALILEIEQVVGKGTFDFFYMPWDSKSDSNCGSAVVNFMSPLNAMMCISGLSQRKFRLVNSQKVCEVLPAHVQGLAKNLEYYRDRAKNLECDAEGNIHGPRVFKQGSEVDFWLAMKEHCPGLVEKAKAGTGGYADEGADGPLPKSATSEGEGAPDQPEVSEPREGDLPDGEKKKPSLWEQLGHKQDECDDASESQGSSQASSASCSTEFSQISEGVMNAFSEKFGC